MLLSGLLSHHQHLTMKHYPLFALSALVLSGCIYSDLGRTVGSIGTSVPRIVPHASTKEWGDLYCGQLYRRDNRYFAELPMVMVPERRKGYEFMPLYSPSGDMLNNSVTYNRPYTAEELRQYPVEKIYFEITEPTDGIYRNQNLITHFKRPDIHGARGVVSAELIPAADFTPEGAEALGLYGIDGVPHRIGHLRKHHSTAHYLLLPVRILAGIIDIPLSAVLMPLSTPIICGALDADWECAVPYLDNSRVHWLKDHPQYPAKEREKSH